MAIRVILIVVGLALICAAPALAQDEKQTATALVNLNVRRCPDVSCAKLGTIRAGGKFVVDEVRDGWAGFSYWGKPGWVKADPAFVALPGATGSTTQYRVASISLDPAIPEPGRAFRLVLSLEANEDTETSVGVLWANEAFAMAPVRLRAGAPVVVALDNPGESATGPHQAVAMLDLDMRELPARDGKIIVDYFVDRAATRSSLTVRQFSNFDIDGGEADFSIASGRIEALPGARIEASDTPWSAVHYDMIAPEFTAASIEKNVTLLAVTAEGNRAVLRVVSIDGPIYTVEFRIYE